MKISKKTAVLAVFVCLAMLHGCGIYSLSDASISPDAKTFSVEYFPNSATMVTPILSPTFTDMLQTKFLNQTKLTQATEDGDLAMSGEITNYESRGTAVTADEYASKNRLTVTVRVRFRNRIEPHTNFEKTFSAYEDYDNTRMLQDVEGELIPVIVEKLVDDIFSAAVSNW